MVPPITASRVCPRMLATGTPMYPPKKNANPQRNATASGRTKPGSGFTTRDVTLTASAAATDQAITVPVKPAGITDPKRVCRIHSPNGNATDASQTKAAAQTTAATCVRFRVISAPMLWTVVDPATAQQIVPTTSASQPGPATGSSNTPAI